MSPVTIGYYVVRPLSMNDEERLNSRVGVADAAGPLTLVVRGSGLWRLTRQEWKL